MTEMGSISQFQAKAEVSGLSRRNNFYNQIIQYVSCAWGAWNIIAFVANPARRQNVFKNIFQGQTKTYVEGDFR